MKYHHTIRQQIENDGFVVSARRHGKIHTVAASRGGTTHIVQAEELTVAFLEVRRSIQHAADMSYFGQID